MGEPAVITTCNLNEMKIRCGTQSSPLKRRGRSSFASSGFRWMYLLAQSEFPSFPVTGEDGNPGLVFFRRLFGKQLQKLVGAEMMIESKLGA